MATDIYEEITALANRLVRSGASPSDVADGFLAAGSCLEAESGGAARVAAWLAVAIAQWHDIAAALDDSARRPETLQ